MKGSTILKGKLLKLVSIGRTIKNTVKSIFVTPSGAVCQNGFCAMPYSIPMDVKYE